MNILNPKILMLIVIAILVGWLAISAIDAATGWDSPIQTVQESGKRFTCPAPKHAEFNFEVDIPGGALGYTGLTFEGTEWVSEGVSSGWSPQWWIFQSEFKAEFTLTYEDKFWEHTETWEQGATWFDEQGKGIVNFVTPMNNWEGECVDDWSYIEGYGVDYTCKLYQDGELKESVSGTVTL